MCQTYKHSQIAITHLVIIFFSKYLRTALYTIQLDVYRWVPVTTPSAKVATSCMDAPIHCEVGQSLGTMYDTSHKKH